MNIKLQEFLYHIKNQDTLSNNDKAQLQELMGYQIYPLGIAIPNFFAVNNLYKNMSYTECINYLTTNLKSTYLNFYTEDEFNIILQYYLSSLFSTEYKVSTYNLTKINTMATLADQTSKAEIKYIIYYILYDLLSVFINFTNSKSTEITRLFTILTPIEDWYNNITITEIQT